MNEELELHLENMIQNMKEMTVILKRYNDNHRGEDFWYSQIL